MPLHRLINAHRESPGARASLLMVAAIGASSVGSYLYSLLCIRWLGASDYSEVAALTSLTLLVLLPLGSLQTALARDVARRRAAGADDEIHLLLRRSVLRALIGGALLLVVLLAATPLIANLLGVDSYATVAFAAVAIGVSAVVPVLQGGLQGLERFPAFARSILLWAAARPVLAVPLIGVLGVQGAMLAAAIAAMIAVVLTLLPLRDALTAPADRPAERPVMLRMPGFGHAVLGLLAITAITNVDVIWATIELSAHDAGVYASAALVGKVVLFAAAGITAVMLPRVMLHLAHGGDIRRPVKRSILAVVALGATLTLVLAPLPTSLVTWVFGPDFGGTRDLLAPFAAAMTVCAVVQVLLTLAIARGEREYPVALAVVAVVDLVLLALLGRSPGAILAVTAFSGCLSLAAYVVVAWAARRRPVPVPVPEPEPAVRPPAESPVHVPDSGY